MRCREDVESWCKKCTSCAAVKGPRTREKGPIQQCNTGSPLERIAVEATTVAKMLIGNWMSRFGVPMEIHSDQGRNFEPNLFKRVTEALGIRKTRTTPLHLQSDGMVERFNCTMDEHLSKMVIEHQKDWDRHLPLFLLVNRSPVHDTTGQTPARILYATTLRVTQAGDLVWLYNPRKRKGHWPKLSPDWAGPSIVVTRINDVAYRIRRRSKK